MPPSARFGKLDVLVNNAGVRGAGLVEDISGDEWDRVLDINAKGTFLGTRAALPALRNNGGGSIVNISSQLGIVGVDNSGPQYQASKGAVRIFTKATAIQYARDGIRANSVHPGPIATPHDRGRARRPRQVPDHRLPHTPGPIRRTRGRGLRCPLPGLR